MKFILVTEINEYKKLHPNSKFFAKCAWGDWEVGSYGASGWLYRPKHLGGMSLCVCPTETVEVRD
jgi:hypothetical protein